MPARAAPRIARDPKFHSDSKTAGVAPILRALKDYSTAESTKAGGQAWVNSSKDKIKGLLGQASRRTSAQPPSPTERFTYTPLGSKTSIRLLHIDDVGSPNSSVKCTIREYSPSSPPPPYVALSYVWSDPGPILTLDRSANASGQDPPTPKFSLSDTEPLILNGKSFALGPDLDGNQGIGANLHAALVGLQPHLAGRPIWTDAICIDQTDRDEKTVQVARMDEIYMGADEVFVWLGRRHLLRDSALGLLEKWPMFPADPARGNIEFHGKRYATATDFFEATSTGAELVSYMNLFMLISEAWWSRVWTVQEFILARSYTFFYNARIIPTDQLRSAMSWVTFIAAHSPSRLLPQWLTLQPSFFALQDSWRKDHQRLDLLDCVLLGATRFSTDARDKVFAFIGIADPASLKALDGTELRTNYGDRNIGHLYHQVAKCLLGGKAGLSVLSLVVHRFPASPSSTHTLKSAVPGSGVKKPIGNRLLDEYLAKKRNPAPDPSFSPVVEQTLAPELQPNWSGDRPAGEFLPSWVPKLSTTIATAPLFQREMRAAGAVGRKLWDPSWRLFHAASGVKGGGSLSTDSGVLSIEACPLCTIESVALLPQSVRREEVSKSTSPQSVFWHTVRSWFQERHLRDAIYAPTSTPLLDALWRTLVANIWLTTHPAPADVASLFTSWLAGTNASASSIKKEFGLSSKPDPADSDIFQAALGEAGLERTFFVAKSDAVDSDSRHLGLGPAVAQDGDVVMLVAGTHVPYAFRKQQSAGEDKWLLVGEAYVHGAMYGEAIGRQTVPFRKIQVV
ncbi:heterokaryon incompatibility protein-domain-containing protein [Xylariaceae sp. FL1272]|nr:heterokaryon incompatibility protein-domain-containing protein [Xylariaceae sp. FL1272]